MRQLFILLVACCAFVSVEAQQEKNLVFDANAEVRQVKGFNAVEVSGAIDLYLSQGEEEAAAVSAGSAEAVGRIKTEVRNGVLYIFFNENGWNWKRWNNYKMKAYITFKQLNRVEASGACNVKTTETIKTNELKIELSGASDFTGNLAVGMLKLNASGASNINVKGVADKLEIHVSGASNIKGYDLKAEYCKIAASGAADIHITVTKELVASASGGSNIYYKGAGVIKDISTGGGASVKRKSED